MKKKFYITTPIYYVNDVPHIGHTCTTVAADILARFKKQKGEEVFFLTGVDEHGQKIAQEAEKEGLTPKEFCDKIAPRFQEAWKDLNIDFDFFIRTTDQRHEKVVAEVLQKIYDKGDIYKGKYEGWYCVGCEKFLTETELVDRHCPLHPPEKTVWKSEDNWFFKLSKYVPEIIKIIEDEKTNYIFPAGKKSEILAKLKDVKDVSFSRDSVKWGIPAPWDTAQTIYVWIDALINYYSACQFVEGKKDFWPTDLHLLGKEILWFHTVIWQAMLLSAGIELPRKTYTHSFYIIDGQKMSKSLGNVISPKQLIDLFGVDGTRYLIATSFPAENDADVGMTRFKEKYNADLANNLGNLVSRVSKLSEGLKVEKHLINFEPDYEDYFSVSEPETKGRGTLDFAGTIGFIFDSWINPANELLNKEVPWKLEKTDEKRVKVLKEVILYIKISSFHLRPFMPETCRRIDEIFNGAVVKSLDKPLFPRIK